MEIKGNPKVNSDKMTVDGLPIRGWVVMLTDGKNKVQKWMERFKPDKVPEGCVAEPLVEYSAVERAMKAKPMVALEGNLPRNVNGPAPQDRPPAPPGPPAVAPKTINLVVTQGYNDEKLKELRRTCNINRNQGATTIDIAYVLSCLES